MLIIRARPASHQGTTSPVTEWLRLPVSSGDTRRHERARSRHFLASEPVSVSGDPAEFGVLAFGDGPRCLAAAFFARPVEQPPGGRMAPQQRFARGPSSGINRG